MVSILEGQLTRTWIIMTEEKKNTINLYHDTITGVRITISNGLQSTLVNYTSLNIRIVTTRKL